MAISIRGNAGSYVDTNSSTTLTVTLPTHAAGDMLIVRAACKPYTASIVVDTSGWAAAGDAYANGSTSNGNGVGSLNFRAFYKIATSASETNPVVTFGATPSPGMAVAVVYQKGSGEAWVTPVGAGGGDSTERTSQTCTISSHISTTAGDMVDFYLAWCDNYASTNPTFTQTDVTFGTVAEQPATALSTSTGNDGAMDGGYRLASSGTSSAAAVVTATFGNTEQGGAWTTRLRVYSSTSVDAGLASATATGYGSIHDLGAQTGAGAATATAYGATGQAGAIGDAGLASATATALAATASIDPNAGPATATAAGLTAVADLGAAAGLSTATAVAYGAEGLPGKAADAGLATATATGLAASIEVGAAAGAATAAASGLDAIIDIGAQTGVAETTAVGYDATAQTATATNVDAGLASATASGLAAIADIRAVAGTGTAAATGYGPAASLEPVAGLASTVATAHDVTWAVSGAALADAGLAEATATGLPVIFSILPNGGIATALAAAPGATAGVGPVTLPTAATATAYDVTALVPGAWPAGLASATATALGVRPGNIGGYPPRPFGRHLTPTSTARHLVPVGIASHPRPEE